MDEQPLKRSTRTTENDGAIWQPVSDMMTSLMLVFVLFLVVVIYQNLVKKNELTAKINEFFNKRKEIVAELISLQAELAEEGVLVCIHAERGSVIIPSDNLFAKGRWDLITPDSVTKTPDGTREDKAKCPADSKSPSQMPPAKKPGTEILNSFLNRYLKIVLHRKYRDYISDIFIEGYADKSPFGRVLSIDCYNKDWRKRYESDGDFLFNLCLSQKRAETVVHFIWDHYEDWHLEESLFDDDNLEILLRERIVPSGKSYNNLLETDDLSRRVEFRFDVNDREGVQKILSELK